MSGKRGRPRLQAPPRVYQIKLRLYPGRHDQLIDWLDELPTRQMSGHIRQALVMGATPHAGQEIDDTAAKLLDDLIDFDLGV